MSFDTTAEVSLNGSHTISEEQSSEHASLTASQWAKLGRAIRARAGKKSPHDVFGPAALGGSIYRWGVAASVGGPCGDLVQLLSVLAVDESPKNSLLAAIDLPTSVEVFIDSVTGPTHSVRQSAMAILWAASLPSLIDRIDSRLWWDLLGTLQQLRESTLQLNASSSPTQLMIGGELGLTLGWRLADLPSCKRLAKASVAEIDRWFADEADSIAVAAKGGVDIRLLLASIIRCQRLLIGTRKSNLKKRQIEIASDVVVWAASLTEQGGTSAFSDAKRADVRDDVATHGLFRSATVYDPETLGPAILAALGESKSGGRLAWQVSLPEAMQHCEVSKIAVLLPEWDVRRGRTHIDYSREDMRIELFAGRHQALGGDIQVMIEINGEEQQAKSDWNYTCEHSDDDVLYLELEQAWTGGVTLQRQVMLIREDRCVMIADTVTPSEPSIAANVGDDPRQIRYVSRMPLAGDLTPSEEVDTREVYLGDTKRRVMFIPLLANEWRVGPTSATLKVEDQYLVHHASAKHSLYAPLWIDCQASRFRRPRTWRQLTVADELRVVRADEAVGFRVQAGSEHWMLYRSLGARRCRTVLGKHLIADFFSGRFSPEDGNIEELVTVDDSESFDD